MRDRIPAIVSKFYQVLPRRDDGTIDYSEASIAAVVMAFVVFEEKILLIKRSNKVRTYKGKWSVVGGYFDELKSPAQKAVEEVSEELGIGQENILAVKRGKRIVQIDSDISMKWVVFPVVIELKNKPEIKLDWENTSYKWLKPEEIENLETVPMLGQIFDAVSLFLIRKN